jgi:hypothetical protein
MQMQELMNNTYLNTSEIQSHNFRKLIQLRVLYAHNLDLPVQSA